MTARVMAAYPGIDPARLLAEWPMALVNGLARMIPRLRAERSFDAADQVTVGIGQAFTTDFPNPARRWRDALQPPTAVTPDQKRAAAATTFSNARALGIGVRVVKVDAR